MRMGLSGVAGRGSAPSSSAFSAGTSTRLQQQVGGTVSQACTGATATVCLKQDTSESWNSLQLAEHRLPIVQATPHPPDGAVTGAGQVVKGTLHGRRLQGRPAPSPSTGRVGPLQDRQAAAGAGLDAHERDSGVGLEQGLLFLLPHPWRL